MILTLNYLTANQSEEFPEADHTLLFEPYKTLHYSLQGESHSLLFFGPAAWYVGF